MVFDGLLVLLGYAFFFEAVWLGLQRAGGNRIPIGWRASREHESGSSWGARSWCMLAGVIFMTLGGANAQVRFIGSWAFLVFVPVILINVIPVLVHNRRVDARASALSHPIL